MSLKWTNFSDFGTLTGPSIPSRSTDIGQTFSQTIGEVYKAKGEADLEFWITILWKDATRDDGTDVREMYRRSDLAYNFLILDRKDLTQGTDTKKPWRGLKRCSKR